MNLYTEEQSEHFLSNAEEDFEHDTQVRSALLFVFNHLNTGIGKKSNYRISFGMLRQMAHLSVDDNPTLLKIIGYLTGDRAKILKIKYEFAEDDFFHELDDDEEVRFLNHEEFYHPATGELVSEAKARIYVFFRPNIGETH